MEHNAVQPLTESDARALNYAMQIFLELETRAHQHMSTMFHWLLATLFAANGGAIVVLAGNKNFASSENLGWFATGLIFSILMGIASAITGAVTASKAATLRRNIFTCLSEGVIPPNLSKELEVLKPKPEIWAPTVSGCISLGCLIEGFLAVAKFL